MGLLAAVRGRDQQVPGAGIVVGLEGGAALLQIHLHYRGCRKILAMIMSLKFRFHDDLLACITEATRFLAISMLAED